MSKLFFVFSMTAIIAGLCLYKFKYSAEENLLSTIESPKADEYPLINLYRWQLVVPDFEPVEIDDTEGFQKVLAGQTLHDILRPFNVSLQEIHALSDSLRPFLLAKDLHENDLYQFELHPLPSGQNAIKHFTIRKLDQNRIPVTYVSTRKDVANPFGSFKIAVTAKEFTELLKVVNVTVKGSLFASFNALPYGSELMQRIMTIFAWKMAMPQNVHNGDTIKILVKHRYVDKKFVGYGLIETAWYKKAGEEYVATYFESNDKKIRGYFDQQGKSYEKELLLSPVLEATQTSMQKWRMHPVRKIRIKHNGIDFRGPVGTPFFSIGDGIVVEKRFDKNVGNMMRIRHPNGVHSEYFHADSLDPKLNVGSRVARGQEIGKIGRTGRLCTGPHLHLGTYRLDGEKRRYLELISLKKSLKWAQNIPILYKNEFALMNERISAKLNELEPSQVLADREQ